MLKKFMRRYQNHCVIFVGYSFFDMDFATVLYEMRKSQDARGVHWFAVTPRNMNEYSYVRSMYDRRFGVLHIDMTFYELMAELDKDFPYLPDNWKLEDIQPRIAEGCIQDGVIPKR
jgi:hypothetical protein